MKRARTASPVIIILIITFQFLIQINVNIKWLFRYNNFQNLNPIKFNLIVTIK